MKRRVMVIVMMLFLAMGGGVKAEVQTEDVCYSQCAAYKFVWQGDYCWDLFSQNCSIGSGGGIKETIKFLKKVKSIVQEGEGIDSIFTAWFVCKPLIQNCIAPKLADCRTVCSQDKLYYAPDLSVGSEASRFHGIVYDPKKKELILKVVNNGMGYAWNIGVEASWGHTANRDGRVNGGGQLLAERIEHLIYVGARNGPPKTAGDYITDFLIEESNFSKFLQGFKSEANDYNVPNYWIKTIPWEPVAGELNEVILNVDPNQDIAESNESDNHFVLRIDLRPTPARFGIEELNYSLVPGTMNSFGVSLKIKNSGEENGTAEVKIKNKNGETVFVSRPVVGGGENYQIETIIEVPIENSYCGQMREYDLIVSDEEGNDSKRIFNLPVYSGEVAGRVEDLFGKKVEGATIRASSGQETTSNKFGNWRLTGLDRLGKITITATKAEFSRSESREIELKIEDEFRPCSQANLKFSGVNFVLKDQEVVFTIVVRDRQGNPLTAKVTAANSDWRLEQEVEGESILAGLQPGEYFFTIGVPGYKTIGQTVNAVPNNQRLEFVLDKLNGRNDDATMSFGEPVLLWEKELGEEVLAEAAVAKDGRTVAYYTSRNRPNSGKLYLIDSFSGEVRRTVETVSNGGNSRSSLDIAYDGTVSLCSNDGAISGKNKGKNWLKLYRPDGSGLGGMEYDNGLATGICAISPDGFFVYPYGLVNKGFHQYTDWEILGQEKNNSRVSYGSYRGIDFTTKNQIIAGCPKGNGWCVQNINKTIAWQLGSASGQIIDSESNQAGNRIGVMTNQKIYLFDGGSQLWEKEVETKSNPLSLSISPGGKFVIFSTYGENEPHRSLRILSDSQVDKTPAGLTTGRLEDVVAVSANDKGVFYLAKKGKKMKYYQVGHYANEYQGEEAPTPTIVTTTNGVSRWGNGAWQAMGGIVWSDLTMKTIYRANQNLSFNLGSLGTLKVTEDSLFGRDNDGQPILLKGQMTADFDSQAIIYAIKFDRNEMDLFGQKLTDLTDGNLAEEEYFVIQNIHTKFIVKNEEKLLTVISQTGEVLVKTKGVDEKVNSGQQISVDEKNNVKKEKYVNPTWVVIVGAGLLLVSAGWWYQKSKR